MTSVRRCLAVLSGLLLGSVPVLAFEVTITHPSFLEPAFGEVEVLAHVASEKPLENVSLFVDGRPQARLEEPPFRWVVNVGSANREHIFRIVAQDVTGERTETAITTPKLAIDERVDIELQQLYVTVTRNGQAVDNLRRKQFSIEDRGQRQTLVTFERGDVPLTAVVLMDTSESMAGAELEIALASAKSFIGDLAPLDQTMLLLFSDHIIRSTAFTGFRDVLSVALTSVTAKGATAINDHLYVALKLLEQRQGRRVVLLLSDGVDSASVLNMRDVARYAERSQALVYWLRLPIPGTRLSSAWRDPDNYRKELETLELIVRTSGGRNVELASIEQAAAAFEEILAELRGQYVLGYYPSNRSDDGSWHPVKVRVAGPELKVRTRRGYIDF